MVHSNQIAVFYNNDYVPYIKLTDQTRDMQQDEIFFSPLTTDISLQKVLCYETREVIFKFLDEYDVSEAEALDIFSETKKWLYLCHLSNGEDVSISITEPLLVIDKMWHTFLQFTREYHQFCMGSFGIFIHHAPFSKSDLVTLQAALQRENKTLQQYKQESYEKEITFTLSHLGRETVIKWYCEYGQKFSLGNLNKLAKLPFDELVSPSEPFSQADVIDLGDAELCTKIVGQYTMSAYCDGHGCGPYCRCSRPPNT